MGVINRSFKWLTSYVSGNNIDIRNGGHTMFHFFGTSNKANVAVTPETAFKVSAFYSCVRNISEDIAKLPFKVLLVDSAGNKINQKFHPASTLLNQKPNQYSTPLTLKQTIIDRALRKGNGYALIIRNDDATPVEMLFIETENVVPILQERKLFYRINDPVLGIEGVYSGEDVFHLRGMGDGYQGISVLKYAAESMGKAIATQEYAAKFYGSGANMTGLLKANGYTDEAKAKKVKESFMRSYLEDGVGMMPGNVDFQKMSFSADEAQMLGSQEFNVKDVARWFRMPLSKLQTSESISNIEALSIEYVNDCLDPWITRFEQEVAAKLFTAKEQQMLEARIDTWPLLKGDTAAQERRIKTLFYVGAGSANDALRSLDLNTIPNGDRKYVPVNMVPVDLVNTFWSSKNSTNVPTGSPDASGSGANNGNINQQ